MPWAVARDISDPGEAVASLTRHQLRSIDRVRVGSFGSWKGCRRKQPQRLRKPMMTYSAYDIRGPQMVLQLATSGICRTCFMLFFHITYQPAIGRDSSVVIATRYGLDGPEIESRWGTRLSAHGQTCRGAHNGYRVLPGGKAAGAWR